MKPWKSQKQKLKARSSIIRNTSLGENSLITLKTTRVLKTEISKDIILKLEKRSKLKEKRQLNCEIKLKMRRQDE